MSHKKRSLSKLERIDPRSAGLIPPGKPNGRKIYASDEEYMSFTTIRLSFPLDRNKELSELSLCLIGQFFYEQDQPFDLAFYMRTEFLLSVMSSNRNIDLLPDGNIKNICIVLYFILKYGECKERTGEYKTREELWNICLFKTWGWNTIHISSRAHKSRSDVWGPRCLQWIEIKIVGEDYESSRGKRYDSYTKGYHDGKSLRTVDPSAFQVLDRSSYEPKRVLTVLDLWDPDEWRRNL